ncbi:ribosome maturation factor RimM [Oenococcus kitaharae]|uniref:Ribosome maturation factor RimM n=1 Tax=Oenococcus kitaharae DSM 17330 TaxID=1045004 RepID=G9WGB2_9LACO|nr:ribosome maturation factor RimM [Oenococcus kitaharae]EHN59720.1 16S rRNA processing protein [Oenococcus kitaharae DSM 17330]OEY83549.1 ribosome maturation factor RimM [Oenococcus kitaharae]OEY85348.1 ribosome maturation factor RimM [Oenococcus kitaharae]OEY86200.1 ribosome maturation factor RimM [Oenococcus kitaharae]
MAKLRVGKIINTHGIKGELKIDVVTDFPDQRFAKKAKLFVSDKELTILTSRPFHQFWLVTFAGYEDINLVEQYKGQDIFVDESVSQPKTLPGEFFVSQILGLQAVDENGRVIGQIVDSFHTGANDVWTIKKTNGKEILIPYIDQVVKKVDLAGRQVTIDLLEGLDED